MPSEAPVDSYEVKDVKPKHGTWQTYDSTDGLPAGVICLLQDRSSYLWLGTQAGLCRYDGQRFITYTTADGLVNNKVEAICEDRRGRLWLGTGGGVSCYDGRCFTNYTTVDGLVDNHIIAICEDNRDALWFATQHGVSRYDGQQFVTITDADGLAGNNVWAICADSHGRLWFGTQEDGVSCYDEGHFTTYTTNDGLAGNSAMAICEDHRGRLWFGNGTWGSGKGVTMFDEGRFVIYTDADGLAGNNVWSICADRQGRLWFGAFSSGVSMFDGQRFVNYTIQDGLLGNFVTGIIQDDEGHFWMAEELAGLTRFDPETMERLTDESVPENLIQDRKGRLWFGNEDKLYCLAEGQQYQKTFRGLIHCPLEDAAGGLWIVTRGDGVYYYNSPDDVWRNTGDAHELRTHFTTDDGLSSDHSYALFEARDGTIWVATAAPGCICRYNAEMKAFEAISTPHPVIFDLFEDSQGRIWIAGFGGLSCYDGNKIVATYTIDDGLPDDKVTSLIEDDAGDLWIGTIEGLYRFDGKQFIRYGEEQGLFSFSHWRSVKDTSGQLWFGTITGGLYRYDGKHFQWLTAEDGLPSNGVTGLVSQADGSMIIGTYRGAVHYRPTATSPPDIEIQEITADEVYHSATELELTAMGKGGDVNLLTISYRGLSLATRRMRYSYILEGCDSEWQDTWENHVRYENLPPGEYTFKVIAINRNLIPSKEAATLRLKIVPDPRDQHIEELESELEQRNRELEQANAELTAQNLELSESHREIEVAHTELKQTQTQLVQSEKMAGLGHLAAGIAHEINNPIAAINSVADISTRCLSRIMDVLQASDTTDEVIKNRAFRRAIGILEKNQQTTLSGSDRIAEIVGNLRNFARLDEAEFQLADIHAGILSTLSLLGNRLAGKITVHKEFSAIPQIQCYPGQLNQVMMNLLQNAADAIDGQGEVWIKTWQSNDSVKISVKDNGTGIPTEALPKIFDPFFTTKPVGSGQGLGLALAHQIVETHGGNIDVKSSMAEGTEFVLTLPIQPSIVAEREERL